MFNNNTHEQLVSLNEVNSTIPGKNRNYSSFKVIKVLLYRAILPQMVKRRNGLMLIMASASAMSPQPVMPAYGATKSYVLQLSQALSLI